MKLITAKNIFLIFISLFIGIIFIQSNVNTHADTLFFGYHTEAQKKAIEAQDKKDAAIEEKRGAVDDAKWEQLSINDSRAAIKYDLKHHKNMLEDPELYGVNLKKYGYKNSGTDGLGINGYDPYNDAFAFKNIKFKTLNKAIVFNNSRLIKNKFSKTIKAGNMLQSMRLIKHKKMRVIQIGKNSFVKYSPYRFYFYF